MLFFGGDLKCLIYPCAFVDNMFSKAISKLVEGYDYLSLA
jgi:hypothetical protein